ncbi:MAG: hypothetical protein ABJZ70_04930 [Cyclobacteriaceae bacterium]
MITAVLGFSNEPISSHLTLLLSTVEDVTEQMGIEAAMSCQKYYQERS